MKIIYAENYDAMSRKAANIISAQVILKPDCVLGLATGSSPLATYRQLIEWYRKGDLDFSDCRSVNLDEYVGLTAEDEHSYAFFMKDNFFSHINIDPNNTNIPDGTNHDVTAECARYNQVISTLGGIDLQLLGIGRNGHIGFNEPGVAFEKETHCVDLKESTIDANKRFFKCESDVPRKAYTMGIKNIMSAKRVLLIASGAEKADIICRMTTGPITPEVPASILQLHNNSTIIADRAALSVLMKKAPELITVTGNDKANF